METERSYDHFSSRNYSLAYQTFLQPVLFHATKTKAPLSATDMHFIGTQKRPFLFKTVPKNPKFSQRTIDFYDNQEHREHEVKSRYSRFAFTTPVADEVFRAYPLDPYKTRDALLRFEQPCFLLQSTTGTWMEDLIQQWVLHPHLPCKFS